MRFCTLAVLLDVTAADGSKIPMTTLSHLEGGRYERSGWLLVLSRWAGLTAPPMSLLWHTVVSSRSDVKLYKWPVFIW